MPYHSSFEPDDFCPCNHDPDSGESYKSVLRWKLNNDAIEACGIEYLYVSVPNALLWVAQQYEGSLSGTHFRTVVNVLRAVVDEFYPADHDDIDYRDFHGSDGPFGDEHEAATFFETIEHIADQASGDLLVTDRPDANTSVLVRQLQLNPTELRARYAASRICALPVDQGLLVLDEEGYIVHSEDGIELAVEAETLEVECSNILRPRVITLDFPHRAIQKYRVNGVRFCVRDFLLREANLCEASGLFDECPDPLLASKLRDLANRFYPDWDGRVAARRAYNERIYGLGRGPLSETERLELSEFAKSAGIRPIGEVDSTGNWVE